MGITSLLILSGQVFAFFFQLGNYLSRSNDKTRLRFLLLTFVFILFNAAWFILIMMTEDASLHIRNNAVIVAGLALGAYYYYYSISELPIKRITAVISMKWLLSLLGSIVLVFASLIYLVGSSGLAAAILIGFCIALVCFIGWKVLFSLAKSEFRSKSTSYRVFLLGSYSGLVCISILPVILSIFGMSLFGLLLANLAYLTLFAGYLSFLLQQSHIENRILTNSGFVPNSAVDREVDNFFEVEFKELTSSEKTVAIYMLKGMLHKEIADKMCLATNTITSHASNIYKKTNCKGKDEFLARFNHFSNDSLSS